MTTLQLVLSLALATERLGVIAFDMFGPGQRVGYIQVRWFWFLMVVEAPLTASFLIPHWFVVGCWIFGSVLLKGMLWSRLVGPDLRSGSTPASGNDAKYYGKSHLQTMLFRMVTNCDLLVLLLLIERSRDCIAC